MWRLCWLVQLNKGEDDQVTSGRRERRVMKRVKEDESSDRQQHRPRRPYSLSSHHSLIASSMGYAMTYFKVQFCYPTNY